MLFVGSIALTLPAAATEMLSIMKIEVETGRGVGRGVVGAVVTRAGTASGTLVVS